MRYIQGVFWVGAAMFILSLMLPGPWDWRTGFDLHLAYLFGLLLEPLEVLPVLFSSIVVIVRIVLFRPVATVPIQLSPLGIVLALILWATAYFKAAALLESAQFSDEQLHLWIGAYLWVSSYLLIGFTLLFTGRSSTSRTPETLTVRIRSTLRSKWLWPLWFLLAGATLLRGWQEVMAQPCRTVWSPNKQFKVEYSVYGYVPGLYYYRYGMSEGYDWPGFIRIADKNDRTLERRDDSGMSDCTCIGLQAQPAKPSQDLLEAYVCRGNEKPDELVGDLSRVRGHVFWKGRPRDGKEKWQVLWGNENADITTQLPAPPLD